MSTSSAPRSGERWLPRSEQEISEAAASGLLEETHYLDLKREVKSGRSANKELARDLAQFAIDGGALLIGVDEVAGAAPTLAPVDLEGLAERVEQVGLASCDPPLAVSCSPIPSSDDPTKGYLLVRVPASGLAPHMVEGTYYARGDKTRTRLSDPEVLRMHAERQRSRQRIEELLDEYIDRDPVPVDERRQAHVYFVAAPLLLRDEMLLDLVTGDGRHAVIHGFLAAASSAVSGSVPVPHLTDATTPVRTPDGIAVTAGLTDGRQLVRNGQGEVVEKILKVEFSDDGVVRVLHTHMSDQVSPDRWALFEDGPVSLVRQAVELASRVDQHAGYGDGWVLGVAMTGIAGLPAYLGGDVGAQARIDEAQTEYRRSTLTSGHELGSAPGSVSERLVGRYLRSLGIENLPKIRAIVEDQQSHV